MFVLLFCLHSLLAESSVVTEGSRVTILIEGMAFGEGPAKAVNGDLYFVDFKSNEILALECPNAAKPQMYGEDCCFH